MELTIETINSLAKIMSEEALTSLEIDQGNLKINMKRDSHLSQKSIPEIIQQSAAPGHHVMNFLPEDEKEILEPQVDLSLTEIKSPIVGVFYQSSQPDGKPYISVGQTFSEGDTLCIIEAMKLMNEITAESTGTIMEVCVENGQVVEYGQVLYRIQEGK